MKKIFLILTAAVALAGCSKKPRSIFDYKDCVFSGTSGLLKTFEPEDNNGYSLVLLSAGSPVKLLDWNKEWERFHVRDQNDMHPKKVTVKKVTGVKLVTLFILILAVTQHIH